MILVRKTGWLCRWNDLEKDSGLGECNDWQRSTTKPNNLMKNKANKTIYAYLVIKIIYLKLQLSSYDPNGNKSKC